MECKFCYRELLGSDTCPYCGKSNVEEPEASPEQEMPAFDTAGEVEAVLEQEGEAVIIVSQEEDLEEDDFFADEDAREEEPQEEDSQVEEVIASPQVKKLKRFAILSGCLAVLALLGTVLFLGIKAGWKTEWDIDLDFKKIFWIREDSLLGNDTYSVSDKKAASKREDVVATLGDSELTNGELQVYYWMEVISFLDSYGYYLSYVGMDYTQPLDEQTSMDGESTWQQYFLAAAIETWQSNQALTMEAAANGYTLDAEYQEYLDGLKESLEETAKSYEFDSADAMLQEEMGPGCTVDDYVSYMRSYYTGYMYFSSLYEALDPTDEDIEKFFTDNESDMTAQGITKDGGKYYSIRQIQINVEGGTEDDEGNITYTDEEWETCRQTAQALLDQWLAGEEVTEDSFTALVAENSDDTDTKDYGGLYQSFVKENMKELFGESYEDWCVAEDRKAGDYQLIQSEQGYHLVYFVDSEDIWYAESEAALLSELSVELVEDALAKYELDVDYKKIVLGVVELA